MSENHGGTADEAAIRDLVERWAAAVGGKDLGGILRDHSPELLLFDVPPPLQSKGIQAYARSWELFFSWSHDPVVYDIGEMSITTGDDVAFVAAVMRCAGTEADGTDIDLRFRLTMGLRKIDGRWIVVHEHHSIPATQ